jgi:FMN phosphatase YigB (HAD superfamily)
MKKIKLIIFDVDNTLVYGNEALRYYKQYSPLLEKTLSETIGVSIAEAKQIADSHRKQFNGRGERSFETYSKDMTNWYDAICTLDPSIYVPEMTESQKVLSFLLSQGYSLGAITDGPTKQSLRILRSAQIDTNSFQFLIGWERGECMPKGGSIDVFKKVLEEYQLNPEEILMVGDSLETDIHPALSCGIRAIYISEEVDDQFETIRSVESLPDYL